jgi:N6-L-threonylcarbamoyladenine synthase
MHFFQEPILAIETSCDETSTAVVLGRKVLSNLVSSQVQLHEKWGGVVPEMAARAHVEAIIPMIQEALQVAQVKLKDIRAIAVTNRPGLVGSLSVGLTAAKALAMYLEVPLIGIHHIEGHILSVLADVDQQPLFALKNFPHLCLVVSGGHTELVEVIQPGHYHVLGQTLDDAAGEAFDKAARLLGLGFPGGRAIQEVAKDHDPKRYPLPRALPKDPYHFSFSGLKTAVLRLIEKEAEALSVGDAAASVQEAIVDALTRKALSAAEELSHKVLTVAGGVSANALLRERLTQECSKAGIEFYCPSYELCTDNAAMIGVVASFRLSLGECDDLNLDVCSDAQLPERPWGK